MAGLSAIFSGGWQGMLGPVAHLRRADDDTVSGTRTAAGGVLRVARVWPAWTSGPDQSTLPEIAGELLWTDRYRRALVTADLTTEQLGFQLRTRASLGAGRDLPLAAQLPLGGSLGFPGLVPNERRGNRVGFATLALSHAIVGPVHARIEVGRGYVQSVWASGADFGLATDTPIGPLTLSYGVATPARRVVKLRIGG
jgi:hypothetical protein